MDPFADRFPRTFATVEAGRTEGLHHAAQIFVSQRGETRLDAAVGTASPVVPAGGDGEDTAADVALRPDSLSLWLSSGKPVAAVAILQCVEQGKLKLDDPVAAHLPPFAQNGKQDVTVRHLLTHTGGFRFVDIGDAHASWDEIIRRLCVAPLERDWTPGKRAGYHPYTSWYVLGELIERFSGVPYSQYVRERIFEPLGMHDCWIGMPAEVRDAYGDRLVELANTERRPAAQPAGDRGVIPAPHPLSTPDGVMRCVPGAGSFGPMRELARLYEALGEGGQRDGVRILAPESVAELVRRQRIGLSDETFKHTLDWGLGMIPNNRRYGVDTAPYGFGRHASEEAFGHGGSQSSVGFCDPPHGLAVALVFNGTCGEARHQRRIRATLDGLYEDLGITRDD